MPETPFLELRSISYSCTGSKEPLFNDLSLSISATDRIGLIGPNGSGKTTMLHLMVGLLRPRTGSVRFLGRELVRESDFRTLRSRVGFLFQHADDQLFSPTVIDDVAFGPLNLGSPREEARQIALNTLERLGLAGFEDRITHRLSGGEKKLVSLATVLAMEPDFLLLDEPTNGLDPETRDRLVHILGELEQGALIISHDWDFLERTSSRFMALENGELGVREGVHLHSHCHAHALGHVGHVHGHVSG
jgi:cobalt/nickel transport system ATP-binding protein